MDPKTPYQFAKEWVKKRFVSFTIDDLKQAFKMAGGRSPIHFSEWGGVIRMLESKNLIFKHPTNPYTTTLRPNGKSKIITVWISREYSMKQASNRKHDKTLTLNFE